LVNIIYLINFNMANTKIVDKPVLHQLRLEEELRDHLDLIASMDKRSRNSLIIELIEESISGRSGQ